MVAAGFSLRKGGIMFKTKFIEEEITYDGSQLHPHFIYEECDIIGDAVVAFIGKCDVRLENMVDLADVKQSQPIYSEKMLHFIGEFFESNLGKNVYRQRLFMAIIKDVISLHKNIKVERRGDDLYIKDKKMTVSIATVSPVSSLIHIGINISSRNTPVKTVGLHDLRLTPRRIAEKILKAFEEEAKGMYVAKCKVRPV